MRPSIVKKIFIGIVSAILVLEIGLRLGGVVYYRYRLGAPRSGDPGYRILSVGDSYTFGTGAPKGDSYPEQLERILRRAHPDRRYSVINRGVPGRNTSELASRLESMLSAYRPDLVIVLIGHNNDYLGESSYFLFAPWAVHDWRSFILAADVYLSRSKAYGLLKWIARDMRYRFLLDRERKQPQQAQAFCQAGRELFLQALYGQGADAERRRLMNQAKTKLNAAIRLAPNFAQAHLFLGQILEREGNKSEALEQYGIGAFNDPEGNGFSKTVSLGAISVKVDQTAMDSAYLYDLETIARSVRKYNAALMLQAYPQQMTELNPLLRRFAERNHLPLVFHDQSFYDATTHGRAVFAADGHPNEEGYRLMAQDIVMTRLIP